jgi:hypothetical protein
MDPRYPPTTVCLACGKPGNSPYGLDLCGRDKRLIGSYCWRKWQGDSAAEVAPRHEDPTLGRTYLCELCGFWHWTRNEDEVAPAMAAAIAALAQAIRQTGFDINKARGYARKRTPLPAEEAL